MTLDELEELTARVYRDAAVAEASDLRLAVNSVAREPSRPARDAAVRGGALLVVFKLERRVDDLSAAIHWLELAWHQEPTAPRASNLASALLERYGLDGAATDHEYAVTLLRGSLADASASPVQRIRRMTTMLGAMVDAVEHGLDGADLDATLDLGERLVADTQTHDPSNGEAANLLGSAYLLAAQRGHERADLRRMVDLLKQAVESLAADHPDRPPRLSNLAAALLERYEILGDPVDLERAAEMVRVAYMAFPESDPSRTQVLNNLINVKVANYERTGRIDDVGSTLQQAREMSRAFRPGHAMYPVAVDNAGLLVRAVRRALDDPALVDEVVDLHRRAVQATAPGDAALAKRKASLALALSDRYHRDRDPADLHVAIDLGEQSLASESSHEAELLGFAANLANFYHDRYLLIGRMSDLSRAGALFEQGLQRIPTSHHDRVAALNNAGNVHADLYERLGDPTHLANAVALLSEAVEATNDRDPELPARLSNLASVLRRQAFVEDDPEKLSAAAELAERSRSTATQAHHRDVATGLLIDVLRDTWRRDGNAALLTRIVALDEAMGPARTPGRQLRRALIAGLRDDHKSEERYLLSALDHGAELSPSVAIVAAQLLADLGMTRISGDDSTGLDLVERAAATAHTVRARLVGLAEGRRADLSWHREFAGLGALWAQARASARDYDGAWEAFEATRSLVLNQFFPACTPMASTYVPIWATRFGGAALVIRPDRPVQQIPLPGLKAQLVARLARRVAAAALLGRRSLEPVLAATVDTLREAVADRLSRELVDGEPVVWCLGGPLAMLPLAAATYEGKPLVVRHPIRSAVSYASACWAEVETVRTVDPSDVASFAGPEPTQLPPLPSAVWESERFAAPSQRFHGSDATPDRLLQALAQSRMVHIATHATSSAPDPLAHYFALADDQPLYAEAILDAAPLRARVAVLAGCDTARTTVPYADEGLALASAIHAAGVPTVIASLWSVYDRPTAQFMRSFADRLHDRHDPAAAFRDAQISAIGADDSYATWAAFTLLGA